MFQREASERVFAAVRGILDAAPRGRLDRHAVEAVRTPIERMLESEKAAGAITAYAFATDTDPERFIAGMLDLKVEVLVPRPLDMAEWKTLTITLDSTKAAAPVAERTERTTQLIEVSRTRATVQSASRDIRMDIRSVQPRTLAADAPAPTAEWIAPDVPAQRPMNGPALPAGSPAPVTARAGAVRSFLSKLFRDH